ncbi:hypothetical protein PI124_g12351 [Phytophthora idaei]|nr:hypothetical protein PI125_g11926 [Phytophthora idaei]KAG3151307.1 hypothetical protein PI126_g11074 [Phytophthora idaei]KAG3242830.1 hypothetical protein PI124_g12351 [Phytophthora idaei]
MLMHVAAVAYEVQACYSGTNGDGTPYNVFVVESFTCVPENLCSTDTSTSSTNLGTLNIICTNDYMKEIQDLFGNSPSITMNYSAIMTAKLQAMSWDTLHPEIAKVHLGSQSLRWQH